MPRVLDAQKYIIQRRTKFVRNQVGLIEQNFGLMQELAEKDVSLRDTERAGLKCHAKRAVAALSCCTKIKNSRSCYRNELQSRLAWPGAACRGAPTRGTDTASTTAARSMHAMRQAAQAGGCHVTIVLRDVCPGGHSSARQGQAQLRKIAASTRDGCDERSRLAHLGHCRSPASLGLPDHPIK
jgi:hypothetical protein